MLDLAAGTGAGMLGILAAVVDRRNAGFLPKLPLNVNIVAADVSPFALSIYQEMIAILVPTFDAAAVKVNFTAVEWDAMEITATNVLCNNWLSSNDLKEVFVLISNLSGVGKELLDGLARSFQHVNERVSHLPNTLLWVEPPGGGAKAFLKKAAKIIFAPAKWLVPQDPAGLSASYVWLHKLQQFKKELPGGVQILNFVRTAS